ncbi:MAG: hypothetical protein A2Y61_02945 [Chloroflexi bacterium RBG_13_60_13]|nr:MAG: hypothetical protein A2Y61_02945 [Chloroflexi bacterium RBG_13_60_13]
MTRTEMPTKRRAMTKIHNQGRTRANEERSWVGKRQLTKAAANNAERSPEASNDRPKRSWGLETAARL